jgi:hypothetical protein
MMELLRATSIGGCESRFIIPLHLEFLDLLDLLDLLFISLYSSYSRQAVERALFTLILSYHTQTAPMSLDPKVV